MSVKLKRALWLSSAVVLTVVGTVTISAAADVEKKIEPVVVTEPVVDAAKPSEIVVAQASGAAPAPEATEEDKVEKVTVVGSRLRKDKFNSPAPIQVITREETTLQGLASPQEALQSTGVTGGNDQITNNRTGFLTDGGPGANSVSLRGLGAGRTLVLINGRRVAPAGTRGSIGSADLNVLPSAIIDRIEILRDGASAIYGSDAVAGVVNVITRKVEGLTLEGQYNQPFDGGGEQMRVSAVAGYGFDRLTLRGSIEYYERKPITLGDRDWTTCQTDYFFNKATGARLDFIDPKTGQPKCYTINGTGANGVTINTLGTSSTTGVAAAGAVGTTFNRWRPNSAITTGLVGFEGVGGGANTLNPRDTFDPKTKLQTTMISPVEILTGFAEVNYELPEFFDSEIYSEFLYTNRKSSQTFTRQLTLDYRRGSPLIPANLAFSNFSGPTAITGTDRVGVRLFTDGGVNTDSQDVDYLKASVGLRGDFSFFGNLEGWKYDAYYSFAKSDAVYNSSTYLTDKLSNTLDVVTAPVGTPANLVRNGLTCRINTTNPAENCIPAPPVSAAVIGGTFPQDWYSYIFTIAPGNTTYEEATVSFDIDGPLFSVPAGDVLFALGIEHRAAEIDDTPNINSILGNFYNLTSSQPTRGRDDVTEVYAEAEVPLISETRFIHELTISGSGRYTDYASYGADATYKYGVVFSPFDWLTFRGTKGTSYRAPALFEQFLGATTGFLSSASDPCNNWDALPVGSNRRANCQSEGLPAGFTQTSSITVVSGGGGGTGLAAETSENTTVGIIFKPDFMPDWFGDLAVAVDYFDVEINNAVDRPGFSAVTRCYDDPQFRAGGGLCNLVRPRDSLNRLTFDDAYTNIAVQIVEGYDYSVRWRRDIWGVDVLLNASVTQYLSQADALFPEDGLDENNATIRFPEYTGTFDAKFTMDEWKLRYGLEWVGEQDSYAFVGIANPAASQFVLDVDEYYLHHLSVQYLVADWSATLGVRNIADEEPPQISSGFYNRIGNGVFYSGYDLTGRQVFLNVTKSF